MNRDSDDRSTSRRDFLKQSAWGAGLTGLAALPEPEADASGDGHYPASSAPPPRYDFTQGSGALQPDTVVASACQFCNSLCRLNVHLKNGRIIDVVGVEKDPLFVPNALGPRQQMGEAAGSPAYEPANLLVDDRYFDNLSGQQAYKCFACRISRAAPEFR